MDKKLLVFSVFVSLFILGGLSYASAVLQSLGGRTPVNTTLGNVVGGTSVRLNLRNANNSDATPVWNVTVFYNTTGGATKAWSIATLTGVSSNTTCSNNICNKSGGGDKGASFLVDWTFPTANKDYVVVARWQFRNGTKTNATGAFLVNVDTTSPTVSFAGNITDGYVFSSQGRVVRAINWKMLSKVVDKHAKNCTLLTNARYNSIATSVSANKTAVRPFNGTVTATSSAIFNMSLHWTLLPEGQYTWKVTCYDNATTPNSATTSDRTFYFDAVAPDMAATYALSFDDSDPSTKDTSKSGVFQVGGVWTSELLETITMTCDLSESTLASATFYVKAPGQSVFTVVGSSGDTTFDYKDTKKSGVYEAKCVGVNRAGNSSTSSVFKFRLQAEDEGELGGAYVAPADIDFSKQGSKLLVENQGKILSLTFDGKTKHSVEFKEVTRDSVTLVITSTPQTVRMAIGETKNLDLNADGVNDMSVTLNSIVDGKANVDFRKLVGSEEVVKQELTSTTTQATPSQPVTESKGRSMTVIWVILLIVVIGVIIYLVAARRKKK